MNNTEYLHSIVNELCNQGRECEWVEFKENNADREEIGKYISALSNSALLNGKDKAYMIWGLQDQTHMILGTTFKPSEAKIGNEELENWLLQRLSPKINFKFHELNITSKNIVLLEINAANKHPTSFSNHKFVRIGSYRKDLKDLQEKERELWRLLDSVPFELQLACEHLNKERVLDLLDYQAYFDLLQQPVPEGHQAILDTLIADELVHLNDAGSYDITNLGAILFARNLQEFSALKRKSIRVIQYKGKNKQEAVHEIQGKVGYAIGFEMLIEFIIASMSTESLSSPIRKEKILLPKLAVRELVANAIIHQDFLVTGSGVLIELFEDRLELSNPGEPLVDIARLLDAPPKSRNEKLASLMRRVGVCEERGSGVDKVVFEVECNQLPAPLFEKPAGFTRVILFSYRELKNLTRQERIRACYFHACLKYMEQDYMTNTSIRERFGITTKNGAVASRIIKEAVQSGWICIYDETIGAKARKYIPAWARSENV